MLLQRAALHPAHYRPHLLHGADRTWEETNCYMDVVIELVHGLGGEPMALLPTIFACDFEVDQWTFFKCRHDDLFDLYGLNLEELNPYGALREHVARQIAEGRPVLIELDAFHLPDTRGTSYQTEHVKTTVAVVDIDLSLRRMVYFHGQSLYELSDEDFDGVWQAAEVTLPPYVEFAKLDRFHTNLSADVASSVLERSLRRVPTRDPGVALLDNLDEAYRAMRETGDLDAFHLYAFATLRQFGACLELAADYLTWWPSTPLVEGTTISALRDASQTVKSSQFQLARAIKRDKPLPIEGLTASLQTWRDLTVRLAELPQLRVA